MSDPFKENTLAKSLEQKWYQKKFFWWLFWPLQVLLWLLVKFRRWAYISGFFKSYQMELPVIIVGNINVGGTGKTPVVIWLVEFLRQHGYQPGIVSRGYGGKVENYPYSVALDSKPEQVGDEPLMLKRRLNCPVVVDPKRVRAVEYLQYNEGCNIIISDDGLQHYSLKRDFEIVVLDGERMLGNYWLLPLGPLREPASRLKSVDLVLQNGGEPQLSGIDIFQLASLGIYSLAQQEEKQSWDFFAGKTVHAVAGIGNPKRFFNALKQNNINIIEHPFPDHYHYQKQDLDFGDGLPIIMTEKDAQKCRLWAEDNYWFLKVALLIESEVESRLLKQLSVIKVKKTNHG